MQRSRTIRRTVLIWGAVGEVVESGLLAGLLGWGDFPWHLECHHHFPHPSGHHALFMRYSCARHTLTYDRIFLLQKRAVRAITNSNYLAHSAPLFSDLKILDIFKISALQTAKFMFSYYHQNLPSVFSNLFITSDQVHWYNTRNAHRFRSHPCRTNIKRFTILFQGPKVWNTLPSSLASSSSSFPSFKRKLTEFLMTR